MVSGGQQRDSAIHACICMCVCSVMSDSLQPYGLYPPGSYVHGDSPGKNTGMDSKDTGMDILQGIFLTEGSS